MTKTTDFTQGGIKKQIIFFAIPILLGSLLQQLYQIADSIIVGRMIGPDALAAVSASTTIVMLIVLVMNGFASGVSNLVAQLFGAKKENQITNLAFSTITVLSALCIVLSIIAIIAAEPFMRAVLGVPEEILADSVAYFRIYIASLVFVFLYNIYSFMLRALGNSKAPMIFLAAFSAANVLMDILFVGPLGMGVFGAGLATFIAQAMSVVLTMLYVRKNVPELHIFSKNAKYDAGLFKKSLAIGLPNALQALMLGATNVFLQRLVNSFGTATIAARGVEYRVNVVATQLSNALSRGVSNFSGQNKGAKKYDRINQALKFSLLISVAAGVLISLLVILFNRQIAYVFIKPDAENVADIVSRACMLLNITSISYVFMMAAQILLGVLRGTGQTKFTSAVAVGVVVLQIASAYFLTYFTGLGYLSIPISMVVMWPLAVIALYLSYRSNKWRESSIESTEDYE